MFANVVRIGCARRTASCASATRRRSDTDRASCQGTISNVAQDISSVEGRIWAVALLFASVGLLVSGYTFQLYRPWLYSDTDEERRAEAVVRAVWATFPQVGFMLTAAIPAMSGATGLQWAFGAIHNTMAPLAMLAIVTFETVQLSFGERAFTRFFGSAEEAHRIETELSHRGERPRNSAQFGAILRNFLSLLFTSTGEKLTPLVLTQKLRVLTLLGDFLFVLLLPLALDPHQRLLARDDPVLGQAHGDGHRRARAARHADPVKDPDLSILQGEFSLHLLAQLLAHQPGMGEDLFKGRGGQILKRGVQVGADGPDCARSAAACGGHAAHHRGRVNTKGAPSHGAGSSRAVSSQALTLTQRQYTHVRSAPASAPHAKGHARLLGAAWRR